MNFMNKMERAGVAVELKYCERCGGLWLRRKGENEVYCGPCLEHQADVMSGRCGARRKADSVRIDCLLGVAEVGA